jgi:hypothetical protein
MTRRAAALALAACLAASASGCAEASRPAAASPRAKPRQLSAQPLSAKSPWTQAPAQSGMIVLPAGTTPCDAELWDAADDVTLVQITTCAGAVYHAKQAPGVVDASSALCELTPLLKAVGPSLCPWQGAGVWRSQAGGITGIWPLRFRLGADCFSMQHPPLYGCGAHPLPAHAIGTVAPRPGLEAPKVHAIRDFGTAGHRLVLLDGDPALAPDQVRLVRSDVHFQYATTSVHTLLAGPTSAADAPHGVSGRGDGMLAIAGPTGVWFGAPSSATFERVYVPPPQGAPAASPAPGCCDIAWQANLTGPGTFVLAPRQRPELVLLDDTSAFVVATWVPPNTLPGYQAVAIRALSSNTHDATVILVVEERASAGAPRHVVRWLGWPLLGSRRGPPVPLAKPGLADVPASP